ncbi:zuc, partial [Drosophila busckii]
ETFSSLTQNWIKGHPIWAAMILGSGAVFASEIIWSGIKYVRDKFRIAKNHVLAVLVFNEKSVICADKHKINRNYQCSNKYCKEKHLRILVNLIDRAEYSIDIAMYTVTIFAITDALKHAIARGLNVRLIYDKEMMVCSGSQIEILDKHGVQVRAPANTATALMHHKFCVLDSSSRIKELTGKQQTNNSRSILVSGSANWTQQAFSGNWENTVIYADKAVIACFQNEFDRIWKSL